MDPLYLPVKAPSAPFRPIPDEGSLRRRPQKGRFGPMEIFEMEDALPEAHRSGWEDLYRR